MARNDGATFMTSDDFRTRGERIFGKGWQGTLAAVCGRDKTTISLYATATRPIPAEMSLLMRLMTHALDTGLAIYPAAAIGILADGAILPVEAPSAVRT